MTHVRADDLVFRADPEAAGLDATRVADLVTRLHREIDAGILPSCQVAIARGGEVVFELTLGDAPADARYMIFSCTKPIVASVLWQLMGEGTLDPSQRVVEFIPEFGSNGKEVVTVEQVMLHTSGFPNAPLGPPAWFDRDARVEAFARWRLTLEPGTRYAYHASSAHWVLAEILERIDGLDFRDSIRRRVLDPLDLPRLRVGHVGDDQHDIQAVVPIGEPDLEKIAQALGISEMPWSEVRPETIVAFNEPEVRDLGVPGAGAVSDAASLALFYQALLANPGELWSPAVLADATTHVRTVLPDFLGTPANRTLGLVVAGADGMAARRGLGHTVSPAAFGHDGAGGQIAFADPATGLSFAYLTGGHDQDQVRQWRSTSGIASRGARCAGST